MPSMLYLVYFDVNMGWGQKLWCGHRTPSLLLMWIWGGHKHLPNYTSPVHYLGEGGGLRMICTQEEESLVHFYNIHWFILAVAMQRRTWPTVHHLHYSNNVLCSSIKIHYLRCRYVGSVSVLFHSKWFSPSQIRSRTRHEDVGTPACYHVDTSWLSDCPKNFELRICLIGIIGYLFP